MPRDDRRTGTVAALRDGEGDEQISGGRRLVAGSAFRMAAKLHVVRLTRLQRHWEEAETYRSPDFYIMCETMSILFSACFLFMWSIGSYLPTV